MDGWKAKDSYIGFKVDRSFKERLLADAERRNFRSLSKYIIHVLSLHLRSSELDAMAEKVKQF